MPPIDPASCGNGHLTRTDDELRGHTVWHCENCGSRVIWPDTSVPPVRIHLDTSAHQRIHEAFMQEPDYADAYKRAREVLYDRQARLGRAADLIAGGGLDIVSPEELRELRNVESDDA
jgi:hypothetical protein